MKTLFLSPRFLPGKTFISAALLVATALAASSAYSQTTVSISVSPPIITDQGEEATFTIFASPPPPRRVAVRFALFGTAIPGRNYTLFGDLKKGRIVFLPGQPFATVTLHSFDADGPYELFAGLHIIGGDRYRIGSPDRATVKIQNVR